MLLRRLLSSLGKVAGLIAVGLALLHYAPGAALALGIPALSPILLSAGWLFIAAAMSHAARVVLFPEVDLMVIMRQAISEHNVAAALVALGVCIVLAALLMSQARA